MLAKRGGGDDVGWAMVGEGATGVMGVE